MRVLVTGATGRVGRRFVPRLLAGAEEVRLLVRQEAKAAPLAALGAKVVPGDLRDQDAVAAAVAGTDAIVHLAATLRDGLSEQETREVNTAATERLAEAALAAGVSRFVFASTGLVYGGGLGHPAREDDETPQQPSFAGGSAYPASKAAGERALLRAYRDRGLDLRVLRLGFVYGEGDPHLAESVRWARQWPPHQRMSVVHHADVGQALLRALRAGGVDGRVYNVADDAPPSGYELLAFAGERPAPDAQARPLPDPWHGVLDTERIRAELGYRPIFPSILAARAAGAL
jgi:nucleoside-diphosphate-sugar epimerase